MVLKSPFYEVYPQLLIERFYYSDLYMVCICADKDECGRKLDNCHFNAMCINTDGGFECVCHNGYIGDGIDCIGQFILQ